MPCTSVSKLLFVPLLPRSGVGTGAFSPQWHLGHYPSHCSPLPVDRSLSRHHIPAAQLPTSGERHRLSPIAGNGRARCLQHRCSEAKPSIGSQCARHRRFHPLPSGWVSTAAHLSAVVPWAVATAQSDPTAHRECANHHLPLVCLPFASSTDVGSHILRHLEVIA
jgi:hypothetical protein